MAPLVIGKDHGQLLIESALHSYQIEDIIPLVLKYQLVLK